MKISSNMAATYTIANLNKANNSASTVMKRLSSGLRITSAGDDPSGLAVSNKLDTQVKGLDQANRNVMDGISLVQTAEGALNEVSDMLNRMRELAVQANTDTYSDGDKAAIQMEMDSITDEIKNICKTAEYNKTNILDMNDDMIVQIGANANQYMTVKGSEINLNQVIQQIDGLKYNDADIFSKIDAAVTKNSDIRGRLGAYQNRMEHIVSNLGVSKENMTSALSTIQDADMAEEMTNYTQYNVLTQSAISLLAQANQRPQQVLQLLNS